MRFALAQRPKGQRFLIVWDGCFFKDYFSITEKIISKGLQQVRQLRLKGLKWFVFCCRYGKPGQHLYLCVFVHAALKIWFSFNQELVSVIQNSMLLGLSSVPRLQRQVLATNREHQTLDIFASQRVNLFFLLRVCLVMLSGLSSVPWLQRQVPATHREHLLDIFCNSRVTFMRVCLVSASLRLGVSLRIALLVLPGKIMMHGLSVLVLRGPPVHCSRRVPCEDFWIGVHNSNWKAENCTLRRLRFSGLFWERTSGLSKAALVDPTHHDSTDGCRSPSQLWWTARWNVFGEVRSSPALTHWQSTTRT